MTVDRPAALASDLPAPQDTSQGQQEASTARPLRADARRNRSKVLESARAAFATGGPSVSIDEIARLAGVGPGTVHRHFPTKELLLRAVLLDHLTGIIEQIRLRSAAPDPGEAFFDVMFLLVRKGAGNKAIAETLARMGGADVSGKIAEAERELSDELGSLLSRAQRAGAVRSDLKLTELHALLGGVHAVLHYDDVTFAERLMAIIADGLRPRES